jgi:hypothetical protein
MASRESLVRKEYEARGILRGGELYLQPVAALDYVRRGDEEGLAVLGIEAFELVDGGVRPCLDLILDLSLSDMKLHSWEAVRKRCLRAATDFIQEHVGPGLQLTVVLAGQDAWDIE